METTTCSGGGSKEETSTGSVGGPTAAEAGRSNITETC